ncbi:MAG: glycosyltransferase family 2 protein [Panacibacter sp.]
MRLSIIIVNFNVRYFLEQCLYSVQSAITTINAEVLVVDNCSNDGGIEYLQQKFPWVKFIVNKQNEGFARANNIALRRAKGEFVLFLNPDTIIPENILTESIRFFETHEDAGCIGVRMLDGKGRFLAESKRAFPSPVASFCKLTGLAALFPKSAFFNRYALGALDQNIVHEVAVLCGAYMMGRRDLLQKMDGFDESFFMYGEDIDLSYRIQQMGKKNYYLGHLMMVHFKGESSAKNRGRYMLLFYSSMQIFVKKHYQGMRALGLKVLLYGGITFRAAISFLAMPVRVVFDSIAGALENDEKDIHLIGDAVSTMEAEKIILRHKLKKTFKGSLLIDKKEQFAGASGGKIIFCTGSLLSFEETIQTICKNPGRNYYKWHALNSGSIVGSNHKKDRGIVYSGDTEMTVKEQLSAKLVADLLYELQSVEASRKVQVSDTTQAS